MVPLKVHSFYANENVIHILNESFSAKLINPVDLNLKELIPQRNSLKNQLPNTNPAKSFVSPVIGFRKTEDLYFREKQVDPLSALTRPRYIYSVTTSCVLTVSQTKQVSE